MRLLSALLPLNFEVQKFTPEFCGVGGSMVAARDEFGELILSSWTVSMSGINWSASKIPPSS